MCFSCMMMSIRFTSEERQNKQSRGGTERESESVGEEERAKQTWRYRYGDEGVGASSSQTE